MVTFLKRSKLLSDYYTDRMNKALLEGKDLSKMLGELGFSDTVITQVALADLHGNISRSLLKIESYLANLLLVRKKVIEVATYPLILLTFLVLIMIGLRHYLMPQLGMFGSIGYNHRSFTSLSRTDKIVGSTDSSDVFFQSV